MKKTSAIVPIERVEKAIMLVRGKKVISDAELAKLYGVSTTRRNEQVKRNEDRFPEDFAFRLTKQEFADLISQSELYAFSVLDVIKKVAFQN